MRLRNIKGSKEMLDQSSFVVKSPKDCRGNWNAQFHNEYPIHIEIGMGKGKFITELARRNPEVNYIGIERYASVLLRAVQKLENEEIDNLLFICMDAAELSEVFAPGEVERIYLNFSDPWPKDRHAKRRLTSSAYLARYREILSRTGWLEFKTDNRALFDFSMESIPESGWIVGEYTYDLHSDSMNEGNIMTEYESKFSAEGKPICKLIAKDGRTW